MVGWVLSLAAFYVLVSIFSDGAASRARWKIFIVALVVTQLLYAISIRNPTWLGLAAACGLAGVVSLAGLRFWIQVTKLQAIKITGSYIGFIVVYSFAIGLLFRALGVRAA